MRLPVLRRRGKDRPARHGEGNQGEGAEQEQEPLPGGKGAKPGLEAGHGRHRPASLPGGGRGTNSARIRNLSRLSGCRVVGEVEVTPGNFPARARSGKISFAEGASPSISTFRSSTRRPVSHVFFGGPSVTSFRMRNGSPRPADAS